MVYVEVGVVVEKLSFLPGFPDHLFFFYFYSSVTRKLGNDRPRLYLGVVGLGTGALCALSILSSVSGGKPSNSFNKFTRKKETLYPSASSGMPYIWILSLRARPS